MKHILIIIILLMSGICYGQKIVGSDSLNNLKVGTDYKPTKHKAGFTYYDDRGIKNTLLEWKYVNTWMGVDIYRWRIKSELLGVEALAWTDDCWIDVATGKAYHDKKKFKIIYYK